MIPRRTFRFDLADYSDDTRIVLRQRVPAFGWRSGGILVRIHQWSAAPCYVAIEAYSCSISEQDPSVAFTSTTECALVEFDAANPAAGELRFGAFNPEMVVGPYLQVVLRFMQFSTEPVELTISVDLMGRMAPAPFDPLALGSVQAAYVPGTYDDAADPDVWTAAIGTDATASDDPARTSICACPTFDYSSASGEVHLANAVPTLSWAGSSFGDRQIMTRVDLENVSTSDPTNLWLNSAAISDSLGYLGLHFRKSGSSYYAYYFEFDSAIRKAEVDITSFLSDGRGSLVVQGRRSGGKLSIKIGASPWVEGDAVGGLASTSGTLRLGYRADMTIRAVLTWDINLSDAETDRLVHWGARL